jgi:hypothetical protein
MRPRDGLVGEAVALMVWWSVWTLWDVYLIPFSPVPEVCMLCVCAVYLVVTSGACQRRTTRLLDGGTQTSEKEGD